MRKIAIEYLEDEQFIKWKKRADRERNKLIENGKPKRYRQDLWKELKRILIRYNYGKCMYCEGAYVAGDHDVAEHYRPRREVTEWDNVDKKRKVIDHPGYYWLAYEWQNILLACTKCNSPHPDGEGFKPHLGKYNEFPIGRKKRIESPSKDIKLWFDELKSEKPLLLHPYYDKAENHFKAERFGVIRGITKRGKATIKICDLNRPMLCSARYREEFNIRLRVPTVCNQYLNDKAYKDLLVQNNEIYSVYLNMRLIAYVEKMIEETIGESTKLSV